VGLRHHDGQLVGDLERGLVPAREGLPGVVRLELREEVGLAVRHDLVEPGGLRVVLVGELDLQDVPPGPEGAAAVTSSRPRVPAAVAHLHGPPWAVRDTLLISMSRAYSAKALTGFRTSSSMRTDPV
jgi:hypothetical protein